MGGFQHLKHLPQATVQLQLLQLIEFIKTYLFQGIFLIRRNTRQTNWV